MNDKLGPIDPTSFIRTARRAAGLAHAELARRAATSQAALSTYERGRQSPSLKVTARILAAAGYDLAFAPYVDFEERSAPGLEPFWVPNRLWRVHTPNCFASLQIPDLTQHTPQNVWDLRDWEDRRRAYEIMILGTLPQTMIGHLDGVLLVDLWDELDLPEVIRDAWEPAMTDATRAKRRRPSPTSSPARDRTDDFGATFARIRGFRTLPRPPKQKEKYVTATQAAEILGLSTSLLNRLIADGTIPAMPLVGHYLVRLADVRDLQERQRLAKDAGGRQGG